MVNSKIIIKTGLSKLDEMIGDSAGWAYSELERSSMAWIAYLGVIQVLGTSSSY